MAQLTDVLMGVKGPMSQADREAADVARRQYMVDKVTLSALQELVACPGWQVFKDYCQQEHQLLMSRMEVTADPTTLAKLVGVNLAVESFPAWPERYAKELGEALASAEIESP